MKISETCAYIRAIGGVSGDMLLGALIHLGVDINFINNQLNCLDLGNIELGSCIGTRKGVEGVGLVPLIPDLQSKSFTFKEFVEIIESSKLNEQILSKSLLVFKNLIKAEENAHGTKNIKLHELGSVDTLIDIVGVVAGLESLGLSRIFCSVLPSGHGFIESGHGLMPIPAPAVMELIKMSNAPLYTYADEVFNSIEMITPTGVALVTTLAEFYDPVMTVKKTGFGLGTKDIANYPNVLSIWVGEFMPNVENSKYSLLETNIDDMSPEIIGYVQERLYDLGVLDVWTMSINMKKNRPAIQISCILPIELEREVIDFLLSETSTFGIRAKKIDRHEADRKIIVVATKLGDIKVKAKIVNGKTINVYPEYEDCRRIAIDKKLPLQQVFEIAQIKAKEVLGINPF